MATAGVRRPAGSHARPAEMVALVRATAFRCASAANSVGREDAALGHARLAARREHLVLVSGRLRSTMSSVAGRGELAQVGQESLQRRPGRPRSCATISPGRRRTRSRRPPPRAPRARSRSCSRAQGRPHRGGRSAASARTLPRTLAPSGPLAQLVEQGTFNPKVTGSIPVRPILLYVLIKPIGDATDAERRRDPGRVANGLQTLTAATEGSRPYSVLPSTRLATRVAAVSWRAGMAWEYVLSVRAMSAWPSRSETTLGWTPAASARLAWVCRRSWKRIRGRPARLARRSNRPERLSGWIGLPSGWQKTKSSSRNDGPSRRCSCNWRAR